MNIYGQTRYTETKLFEGGRVQSHCVCVCEGQKAHLNVHTNRCNNSL